MCTSIVVNKNKTIVGWNLDLLGMSHRVRPTESGVYIEVYDEKEGWLPLFGASCSGDFVGMPTCWPYDERSDPKDGSVNVINLDIDFLLGKSTLSKVKDFVDKTPICSVKGVTFMSSLSDADGNVLHVVPGVGHEYYEKPEYKIMTNFSPFSPDASAHPWMGKDRYEKAEEMLKNAPDGFDVTDCFAVLRAVSQEVCPTVVSMVYDVSERTVYWCEHREWDKIQSQKFPV
jgi:hypothetical protein